ncbi:gliding motility-associated-like protein [Flavobacteriaceae bacterium MAR_2010_72]|nr:gliding motility-associated-like protein [Flavobacteriaceae bacterium MAR_2010_72]
MKKNIFFLLLLTCVMCSISFSQQISIDNSVTAQQLIQDNFGQGCVQVSNISSQVNGQVNGFNSFGYFDGSGTNFPFQNGIVLSTGNAVSGANGVNGTVLSEGDPTWTTDADLETALGLTGTLNATSIEFDFISISNQVQFNYIFASEEYNPPYECQFTDSFVFLITEAGSGNPYTNIAVVPGTSTPVNANTVHPDLQPYCAAQNPQYFDGYNLGNTNFNGRTTVMTATAAIVPNVQYHIKLIIADQNDQSFDSAVFIEGNSFNASVDLGEDLSTCAGSVTLDADIGNATATYSWYLNGSLMNGEVLPTLNVTQTGTYRVLVSIPLGNTVCELEDTVTLTLSSTQTASHISNYNFCDDPSGDGVEIFDLSTKNAEVAASVPPSNYTISYHLTSLDAQNNSNPILVPIQNTSSPQPIYVRIEDTNNGCLSFPTFNLVVNPLPNAITPTDLNVCDDDTPDGITQIDLTQKDAEIVSGQSNTIVSYHFTQNDADLGLNSIGSPYTNSNPTEQLYARVTNFSTGCFVTTTLTVNVIDQPIINDGPFYIDACDQDHDGFATFDLTSIISDVIGSLTGVTVTFHESFNDADSRTNAIGNTTNYPNSTINEQTLYIRVENDSNGCAAITPLEIHTNLLLTYTNIINFSLCDIDNDGVQEFDLNQIAIVIINEIPNVNITYYRTENDRDNQTNPIDTSQLYTPASAPETLYIRLTSATCSEVSEFDLLLNTVPTFNNIGSVTYCDDDQDGFTAIDLSTFDLAVANGNSNYTVTYFLTENDANAFVNPLPTNYTNTSNPQTFYARIGDNNTGCASINSFEITVIPAPITSSPSDEIRCVNDANGMATINLTAKISEVVTDTNNRNITFHTALTDAEANTNAISNASSYSTGTRTIYIRVENATTGCYVIESFNITVNTLPVFTTISDFQICENNSDGYAGFVFSTKDAEILNGQNGKQVLYFLNQTDADNRTNIINKSNPYQNISNPQTIYVRVENLSDQTCYGTSSFVLEVGTNPQYNEPSDWFVCDDISNDGRAVFDLSTRVTEISQGIPETLNITFHTSQVNAENGSNALPLQYENAVNPQEIFVRINNGTDCNSITSFVVNVIQAPQVNQAQPLEHCDSNYDGISTFDLTESEVDILDIRQNNIVVEYFESLNDLDNRINAIANPQAYNNFSNPQTVYVRITNTVTDCYLAIDLDLVVNLPPSLNSFSSVELCDNATNSYDLTQVNAIAINGSSNYDISYYSSSADALAETNALNTNYSYQTNSDTIYMRVENPSTTCFTIHSFQLIVRPLPIANQPNNLESCDDNFDGYFPFDLSQQTPVILGSQSSANYTVTYHNSLVSAENGNNDLPMLYAATDQEQIFARVENITTGCYSTTQFMSMVHPRPIVDIGDQVICLENLPLIVSADTGYSGDTYLWSTNETTPEIVISTIGSYWVTVTTPYGCETTEQFNVIESEQATIEFTQTVDFADPNSITVDVSGIGNYEFSLDNGPMQSSNVFENVSIGYHTVTVKDANGCLEVTREVVVIDVPKFMTPNNDGFFDTWHITGVETLPGTVVYIYDRYGKLLKQLSSNSNGWDGTFNGALMPSSDYWFVADVKRNDIEFQVKGHFALKR